MLKPTGHAPLDTGSDDWARTSLLPIILGVSGHRDLRAEDEPALEAGVESIIRTVAARQPYSPLVLLSPLAEGADRLVARVFLRIADGNNRFKLVVPLPAPLAAATAELHAANPSEADELLRHGELLEIADAPTEDASALTRSPYVRTGAFIARHCQLLIALWDGVYNGKPGGTADVVRIRLEGIPAMYLPHSHPLDPPEHGPVYHIHAPRLSGAEPPSRAPGTARLIFPRTWRGGEDPHANLSALLQQIERFNQEATRLMEKEPQRVKLSRAYLTGAEEQLSELRLSASEEHLLNAYAVADALALHHQRRSHSTVLGLLLLGVTAVFMNQAYSSMARGALTGLAYLALLVVGGIWLLVARRYDWQQNYFSYRGLAEGLRVQFFWRVGGVDASVADAYLRSQREDLHGARLALRFFELSFAREAHMAANLARARFVFERWVRDQRDYFLGSAQRPGAVRRDERRLRRLARISRMCFITAVALVAFHIASRFSDLPALVSAGEYMSTLSATLLGAAAALLGYKEVMGFSEHVRHGAKLAELFTRAETQLRSTILEVPDGSRDLVRADDRLHHAHQVLLDLGREALAENAEWVIMHRSRPWQFSIG